VKLAAEGRFSPRSEGGDTVVIRFPSKALLADGFFSNKSEGGRAKTLPPTEATR